MGREGRMGVDITLLRRVDRYLDAAPRTSAEAVDVGALRAFVTSAPWPYYIRPRPDLDLTAASAVTAEEVRDAAGLLERVGRPVAFEWVIELVPSLADVLAAEGYRVRIHPLLVRELHGSTDDDWGHACVDGLHARRPQDPDVRGRLLRADDDVAVAMSLRVSDLGFSVRGTAVGEAGTAERDATQVESSLVDFVRDRIRTRRSVVAVADVAAASVVATGWHQPIDEETEVVGVATVPAFRRQGAGAAVVRTLLGDAARRGVTLALLSADDDAVARVYERVGFTRIGHTAAAEPPA